MKKHSKTVKNPRFSHEVKSGATRSERKEIGKLARKQTSLASHAKTHVAQTGRDIVDVLEKSNRGRIKDLVPVRYGRMLASPFTFFRGSASLMAMDLAPTPNSGFIVQACGDCHVHNFGAFATPERKILVDINDFDETLPAPWEWDVKRLAASLVLAATTNGFSIEVGQEAALRLAQGYREHIAELSDMTIMEAWYSHVELRSLIDQSKGETRRRQQRLLKEAMEKSSPEILMDKLTVTTGGKLHFKDIPPLLCHVEGVTAGHDEQQRAFDAYRKTLPDDRRFLLDKFEMVDIARKVVGIGSVGTMCGLLLLVSSEQDVLILQIKEARESVLGPYAGPSRYDHHGQRVVNGQKLMQAASDMFLGWVTGVKAPYRHFFIRQLRDVKLPVNTAFWSKEEFKFFPKIIGEILARAHARSGDASVLRGYLGKTDEFDQAISLYAVAYAKQTQRDYQHFVKACQSGQLKAQSIE